MCDRDHHYVIPEPNGSEELIGVCKKCQATKKFKSGMAIFGAFGDFSSVDARMTLEAFK